MLPEIHDWNLFWSAFGAIGSTVGSIATAAAVIVALWQTKYTNKKKIKLSLSDCYATYNSVISKRVFIGLDVVNIGNRDIIINNWGYLLDNDKKVQFITESMNDAMLNQLNDHLPCSLKMEESKTLYFPKDVFVKNISENISKGELSPKKHISFYITDSTGKRFIFKTKEKAEAYNIKEAVK